MARDLELPFSALFVKNQPYNGSTLLNQMRERVSWADLAKELGFLSDYYNGILSNLKWTEKCIKEKHWILTQ